MEYKKKKREDNNNNNNNNNNTNFNQFPQNFQYGNYRPNNFSYQSLPNVPPTTKNELEGIVIEYLINNPHYPIDSFTLFRNIKNAFRNIEYSVFVFKNLDINTIIRELIDSHLIECDEIAINLKRCYLIKNISVENLKRYKDENGVNFTINEDFDK